MDVITSKENPNVKDAVRLRESASERRKQGLFFLEGYRLCADALACGYVPETLFVTEAARRKYPLEYENATLVTAPVAQKLGDTTHPQGVFGIFAAKGQAGGFWRDGGLYIALENVQEPGNLGAIARTAQALGLDGLLACGGCDLYHPKALRASMGALLRLPVLWAGDFAAALRGSALPCYAAVPDTGAFPVTQCDFTRGGVVAVGNEGGGLTEEAVAACGQKITIPMGGWAESLNAAAAAAILCWEMVR
jgi:TrmH family RNA methyltransferase